MQCNIFQCSIHKALISPASDINDAKLGPKSKNKQKMLWSPKVCCTLLTQSRKITSTRHVINLTADEMETTEDIVEFGDYWRGCTGDLCNKSLSAECECNGSQKPWGKGAKTRQLC